MRLIVTPRNKYYWGENYIIIGLKNDSNITNSKLIILEELCFRSSYGHELRL